MSDLPKTPPAPAGAYQAVVVHNGLGFVSAQFPFREGRLVYAGRVGAELTEEEGRAAAELAALNVLAQIEAALGSLDRVATLLRVEGHVASVAGWHGHPRVLDGASETYTGEIEIVTHQEHVALSARGKWQAYFEE